MNNNLHVVMIDNQDSFTYNLVDELRILGIELSIYRNTVDVTTIIDALNTASTSSSAILMLSPGPGAPSDAGCMPDAIAHAQGKYPVFGICLGHQAIVEHYSGNVNRAPDVMHGKASLMQHDHPLIFGSLDNPMTIARYHSLVATNVPESLQVIAQSDGLVMAILHQDDKMLGFQFHPESVLTRDGSHLIKQALEFLSDKLLSAELLTNNNAEASQNGI
ncbi:MAG: aminodeoxychorismate/anthranilate synthase component II [Pseudomonadota bacterium]